MLIPIVLYHSVVRNGDPFSVDPNVFADQLTAIRESGRAPLTISELAAGLTSAAPLPERPVAVTIDDGTADFSDTVLPALRAAGLVATLYVMTAQIGGPGMMSWQGVEEAAAGGVEIGAHSRNHPHLDTVPIQRARREIVSSRSDVEHRLGAPCTSFAYPHGSFTRSIRALVSTAGFTSAVAVRNAFSHEQDDVLALARLTVLRDASPALLARWLTGSGAPRTPDGELLRTTVYRQVRRARALFRAVPGAVQ